MDDHLKKLIASGPMRATYHNDTGCIQLVDRNGGGHYLNWSASIQFLLQRQTVSLVSGDQPMTGSIDAQKARYRADVLAAVERLLDAGEQQLQYNVEHNVPNLFIGVGEVAHNSVLRGIVSLVSNFVNFDPTKAAETAAEICEDVNYHDLAKIIRDYNAGVRYRPIHCARKTKRGFQPKASKKKEGVK